MTLRRIIPAIFALVAPAMAAAHPHIFVDTGLRLATDEGGRLSGVEVAWEYDELYSLLVLEDMELDDDYDGKLKPEEMARLAPEPSSWGAVIWEASSDMPKPTISAVGPIAALPSHTNIHGALTAPRGSARRLAV